MSNRRASDRVNNGQTRKIHSKNDGEKKSFFSFAKFSNKGEKTDPRKVDLKKINEDSVAWHLAMLSPSPGESEQLVILRKDGNGYRPIHYDEDASDVGVQTDEREVEKIYVNSPPLSLVDIHTHPEWMPPSFKDVALFLEFDSIGESYLITPKTTDQGINIVYNLKKRKTFRSLNKVENRNEFRKEWDDTLKDAEKEIKRRDDARIDWFSDANLIKAVDKDKDFAIKIKRLELLGKKYGYDVNAYEKDTFLVPADLTSKKKPVAHGLFDSVDLLHPEWDAINNLGDEL